MLCVMLGVLVLAGWALDIAVLKSVAPTLVTMKANTALAFALSGMALWHLRCFEPAPDGGAKRVAQVAAAAVVAIGTLTLSEYLFSWNAGIDQLLFRESATAIGTSVPGRMAPNTALAFLAAGIALLMLLGRTTGRLRSRGQPLIEGMAGIVTMIGLLALLGYATDVKIGYSWGGITGAALHTAAALVALGVGLFAAAWRTKRIHWAVGRSVTGAFVVALGATLILEEASYRTTREMNEAARRVAFANEIRFRSSDLLSAVQDVETASRGYALTGEVSYLEPYLAAVARMHDAVAALRLRTATQPESHQQLGAIEPWITARLEVGRQLIEARRFRGARAAADVVQVGRGKAVMDTIRGRLAAMDSAVARFADEQQATAASATQVAFFALPLAGLFTLVLLPLTLLALNRQAVARDVALAASRRNEEQFRAVFEQTAIGSALVAPDGRFLSVNNTLCEIVGYGREELEELTFQEITHPDDLEADLNLVRQLLDERIRNYTREKRYIRKNGTVVWVSLTVSLVRHEGDAPTYFIAAIEDITERKLLLSQLADNEERFRLAAAATSDAVWDWRVGSEDVWRSKDWPTHFGYPDEEAPTRNWWMSHIHPDDRERVQREIEAALMPPDTRWESEYRFVRADGSHATVKERAFLVRDEDGTASRMVGSTSDITRQVEMAAQLAQAQRMETVGQLAGGVAHDFNNLLAVILGTADLSMRAGTASDEVRADLDLIRQTALRASELTRQLLAFSRRQVLQPKVSSLTRVVESTMPMLRRLIGEHVRISLRLEPALDDVFLDETQLQQVLLNLAVNGRDAMPDGGTLTIATENVMLDEAYAALHPGTAPGAHVALIVSDDGVGMDKLTQLRIFEPFFTTKELGKGTGLGLATVFGIVTQSGGSVWVYSEPGKGTTFKCYFPSVEAPAIAQAPPAAPSLARTTGDEIILVVEDDDYLRRLTTTMIKRLGYTTLVASGGDEALRVLEEHPGRVDLVLTDLVMPGMSGAHLAEQLREIRPATRVLFTSGYGGDAAGSVFQIPEAAKFIPKPFTLDELSRMIIETLAL